jgi:hypothetical protein
MCIDRMSRWVSGHDIRSKKGKNTKNKKGGGNRPVLKEP